MTEEQRLYSHVRYLPGQIARTRLKLERLEREAREYRMHDLLDPARQA